MELCDFYLVLKKRKKMDEGDLVIFHLLLFFFFFFIFIFFFFFPSVWDERKGDSHSHYPISFTLISICSIRAYSTE